MHKQLDGITLIKNVCIVSLDLEPGGLFIRFKLLCLPWTFIFVTVLFIADMDDQFPL